MQGRDEQTLKRALAARARFLEQLREPEQVQENVLRRCLELNQGSRFGAEHRFAEIKDLAAFRRNVPLRAYPDYAPWIERAAAGERGVLTGEDPILFFTSSGSTGKPKKLPVTVPFLREHFVPFVYAAIGNFFSYYPETALRHDATINFKFDPNLDLGATPSGKPYLGASQVDYARTVGEELALEPGVRAPWAAPPRDVSDPLDRLYYRICWAAGADLRAIVGINPAIILAVAQQIGAWSSRLIEEVGAGTLLGKKLRDPDPERAEWLRRLEEESGGLLPQHLWPRLQTVFCWNGAASSVYLPALRGLFGARVQIMPAPVAASEAVVAVPVDRHPSAGPLGLPFTFLEFLDAGAEVRPDSPTSTFSELRTGGEYQVVVTQSAGLCRYALGDVVRVVDWHGRVPRVEFVGRSARVALAGEPLGEWKLAKVLRASLAESGLSVLNFRFCFADAARVQLAVEPASPWNAQDAAALAAHVERRLAEIHPAYRPDPERGKVDVTVLAPGTFVREWEARVRGGIRPAQAKDRVSESDPGAWAAFTAG